MITPNDLSHRCTCAAVRRAARHLTQAYDRHLAPIGLRLSQYSLLNNLADGPSSVGALANRLGMDRTTLGRNLRPLEREGLVSITVDRTDRRGRALALTPTGRAKLADAETRWRQVQAEFETRYGPAETLTLHQTLDELADLRL